MSLFQWLFGRTARPTREIQPERAMKEWQPSPIVRAPARPAFVHAVRVPEGRFRFIALDVETACSDNASICQIGLACVQPNNEIQTFSILVNPGTRFDAFNTQLHGIGPDYVADAPRFQDAWDVLLPLLTSHHLIQHSNFDRQAINAACGSCGISVPELRWSDSVQIARRAWPELRGNGGHGLANLKRTLNLQFHHHDAGEDARAAALVVLHAELHLQLPFTELVKPVAKKNHSAPITMDGNPKGALAGTVVVFTGSLGMTRKEAAELAARAGMTVKPGVTKETTHLVVGDQDLSELAGHTKSSKHRKADDMKRAGHPICIIGESTFKSLVANPEQTG